MPSLVKRLLDNASLLREAADRIAHLEAEVERLTQSRSTIARGLEREEELNADLEAEVERLREALRNLVKMNEEHNAAVEAVIGRPLNWSDNYLDEARAALAGEGDDHG